MSKARMLLVTYNMTKLNFLASKSAMSNPQPASKMSISKVLCSPV